MRVFNPVGNRAIFTKRLLLEAVSDRAGPAQVLIDLHNRFLISWTIGGVQMFKRTEENGLHAPWSEWNRNGKRFSVHQSNAVQQDYAHEVKDPLYHLTKRVQFANSTAKGNE